MKSVEDGHAWAVVKLDHKFTASLYERIFESVTNPDLRTIDTDLLDKSSINIRLDVTNQHIAFTLQLKLVEAFEKFMRQLVSTNWLVSLRSFLVQDTRNRNGTIVKQFCNYTMHGPYLIFLYYINATTYCFGQYCSLRIVIRKSRLF